MTLLHITYTYSVWNCSHMSPGPKWRFQYSPFSGRGKSGATRKQNGNTTSSQQNRTQNHPKYQ